MNVLVAYETRYGSTTDVARAIAARLADHGYSVELRSVGDVRAPQEYSAVVVGAPIYRGRWLAGAHRLLKRIGKLSSESTPAVAVFALGPRVDEGPDSWATPRAQFARALAAHSSVAPISTALFGGADPPRRSTRRDVRDWDAIGSWADDLAGLLRGL